MEVLRPTKRELRAVKRKAAKLRKAASRLQIYSDVEIIKSVLTLERRGVRLDLGI